MVLSQASTEPLYQQLKNILRAAIVSGEYQNGDQIPTEQELMRKYGVSRITVRRAISDLIEEKYLIKIQGKGTFVNIVQTVREMVNISSFTDACERHNEVARSRVLSVVVQKPDAHDMRRLGLGEGDQVIHIARLRFRNEVPLMIEHTYYPYEKFRFLLDEDLTGSIYALLRARLGLVPVRSEQVLELSYATAEQAELLGLNRGAALFKVRAIVFDADGHPVHHNVTYFDGAGNRFSY